MERWQKTLDRLIPLVRPALDDPLTRWALIGSAATALQGCRVTPGDVDFLAAHPQGVRRFAERLAPFSPDRCPLSVEHPDWLSSKAQPISRGPDGRGYIWTFARWRIDGFKVEAAHILPPETTRRSQDRTGIWEAGPDIWPHLRSVSTDHGDIPVAPLEVQLGTCMQRGLDDRVAAILHVLRQRGHDAPLLRLALTPEQFARLGETGDGVLVG